MTEKLQKPPRTDDPDDLRQWLEEVERHLTLVGSRTFDIGSIAPGAVETFTIPVQGCRVNQGQSVAISAPANVPAGLIWSGHVTADNVVTVRVYNSSGVSVDPVLASYGARVFL